jgi:hypothetical protein
MRTAIIGLNLLMLTRTTVLTTTTRRSQVAPRSPAMAWLSPLIFPRVSGSSQSKDPIGTGFIRT